MYEDPMQRHYRYVSTQKLVEKRGVSLTVIFLYPRLTAYPIFTMLRSFHPGRFQTDCDLDYFIGRLRPLR